MCKKCENVTVVINTDLEPLISANNTYDKIFIYNMEEKIFALTHDEDILYAHEYQGLQIYYCPFCGERLTAERCVKNLKELNKPYIKRQTEEYLKTIEKLKRNINNLKNKKMKVFGESEAEYLKQIKKLENKLGELNE